MTRLRQFWIDENGASLVEYSIIVGLIAAVGAAVLQEGGPWALGRKVRYSFYCLDRFWSGLPTDTICRGMGHHN